MSALQFPGGTPESVYRLGLEGRIDLIVSRALLVELGRVLTTKFGWDQVRAEAAVAQLTRVASVVDPKEIVQEITADPADDRILEAALSGSAEVIVSGDRHLLQLRSWRKIRITTPADFLSWFES